MSPLPVAQWRRVGLVLQLAQWLSLGRVPAAWVSVGHWSDEVEWRHTNGGMRLRMIVESAVLYDGMRCNAWLMMLFAYVSRSIQVG